jgi:hypothetical protein
MPLWQSDSSISPTSRPAQRVMSLPHSGKSHFNVWQITPSTPKMGSGRSSISSSLPLPQHSQVRRLLRGDSFAATACNSPRASIVVACRNILNTRTMDFAAIEHCNYWGDEPLAKRANPFVRCVRLLSSRSAGSQSHRLAPASASQSRLQPCCRAAIAPRRRASSA